MLKDGPPSAPTEIQNDLPDEDGLGIHDFGRDGITADDDNHDIVKGADKTGHKISGTDAASRCNDWTSTVGSIGRPVAGHAWPLGSEGNWMSPHPLPGCEAAINVSQVNGCGSGGIDGIGCGGGYGAIYCFATTP